MNPRLFLTAADRPINPAFPTSRYSDDTLMMAPQCATQWDALSHVHYDGELYNGCKACDVLTSTGTTSHGVEHLASPGIMSRGVLLDIAALHGRDILEGSYRIGPDELNRAAEKQGVKVARGDIVLIRTGAIRRFTIENDRAGFAAHHPGLTAACAEWLHDRGVAAVAADNLSVEVMDEECMASEMCLPLHMLCLRDMGMPLGEMFDLEALAADCATDGQYDFLFCAPPLGLTGGVGSPVNPTVLK